MSSEYSHKIKYHLRPCYGSEELLIEFLNKNDFENFGIVFIDSIKEICPKVAGKVDWWFNDEVIYKFKSSQGKFQISSNTWGFVFIEASKNQSILHSINSILENDKRFERIEVDYTEYKLKNGSS